MEELTSKVAAADTKFICHGSRCRKQEVGAGSFVGQQLDWREVVYVSTDRSLKVTDFYGLFIQEAIQLELAIGAGVGRDAAQTGDQDRWPRPENSSRVTPRTRPVAVAKCR